MSKGCEKYDKFKKLGMIGLSNVSMKNCRQLSPYVSLVGTLHSNRWSNSKLVKGKSIKSGKVVGYRFKTERDIKDIITFSIKDGNAACTTDPKGYVRTGTRNIKAGEIFDLNLFETTIFFMRDDILGLISGGNFEVYLFTRASKNKAYITSGLKAFSSNENIKFNEIYVDEKTESGDIVVKEEFQRQYACLGKTRYSKDRKRITLEYGGAPAINVMGLRQVLGDDIWKN